VQDTLNQELLEVKPVKDSCAGTTGTRKELSVDMDFVINEIKNKLRPRLDSSDREKCSIKY